MPAPRNGLGRGTGGTNDTSNTDPAELIAAIVDRPIDALLAALAAGRPAFHEFAECIGSDVDFTSKAPGQRAAAFSLCGACAVRLDCRDWADEIDDRDAILGGEDPAARRARQKRST